MAEPVKMEIGGEVFDLYPLAMRPSRKWRERLTAEVDGLIGLIANIDPDAIELTDMGAIAELLKSVSAPLLAAPDTLAELAYGYFPDLAGRVDEDVATDGEMAAAFMAALKFCYPLGPVWAAVKGLASPTGKAQANKRAGEAMARKANNPDPALAQAIITAAATGPNGNTPQPGRTGRRTRTK